VAWRRLLELGEHVSGWAAARTRRGLGACAGRSDWAAARCCQAGRARGAGAGHDEGKMREWAMRPSWAERKRSYVFSFYFIFYFCYQIYLQY
jgi:hypothetical protein